MKDRPLLQPHLQAAHIQGLPLAPNPSLAQVPTLISVGGSGTHTHLSSDLQKPTRASWHQAQPQKARKRVPPHPHHHRPALRPPAGGRRAGEQVQSHGENGVGKH